MSEIQGKNWAILDNPQLSFFKYLYRISYNDIDNIYTILQQIFEEKSSETIEKYKIY